MTDGVDSSRAAAARRLDSTPARRALDRDIWAMAWPAMLSLMLTNVVDLVDVALIGRLGRDEIAAYGYAAQYLHLVNMAIQSVGIGCVALMSRAIGATDPKRARQVLVSSIAVAQILALLATALFAGLPRQFLGLLRATPEVVEIAVPYFRLVLLSTLLFSVSFMIESALRAHRKTRVPMLITLVITVVKAVLNFGLIFGAMGLPRLGLLGAGVATVAAHSVGMVLYVLAARVAGATGLAVTFGWADTRGILRIAREVFRVALPAIGERFIMSLALLTYFAILSDYGTAAVAAYAIGVRLLSFSWVPGLAFSTAASTFVGQALGSGDAHGAKRAGRRAVLLAVLLMAGLGVVCMIAREPLARVFTHDERVVENLLPFMMMLAVAQPFMGAHFTLGGVLRGAGDTVTPLFGAAVGNWVFRVPLAWAYAEVFGLSLAWVWSALIADHVARMLINGQAFVRGRWAARTGAAVRRPPA